MAIRFLRRQQLIRNQSYTKSHHPQIMKILAAFALIRADSRPRDRRIGQSSGRAGISIRFVSDRKYGERGRNRTYNLLIKSQLLCQLSYAPLLGTGRWAGCGVLRDAGFEMRHRLALDLFDPNKCSGITQRPLPESAAPREASAARVGPRKRYNRRGIFWHCGGGCVTRFLRQSLWIWISSPSSTVRGCGCRVCGARQKSM